MLRSDLGIVKAQGPKFILQAELTVLFKVLLDKKILSIDEIKECLKDGQISDEELAKKREEYENSKEGNTTVKEIEAIIDTLMLLNLLS